MKSTNSHGNNEVASPILKDMPSYTSMSVCHLFDMMLRFDKFPKKFGIACLTPILKQGKDKTNPLSYRPISNLNSVEKLIESFIKTKLDIFLSSQNIITPDHHGGKTQHSTLTGSHIMLSA